MGVGVLWAFMPCGLLYSALMVAALTGNALDGALTMACFALGSGVSLGFAPWLLLKLKTLGDGTWGIRLAGLALAFTSGWGLWLGLAHNQAPWCAVSGSLCCTACIQAVRQRSCPCGTYKPPKTPRRMRILS